MGNQQASSTNNKNRTPEESPYPTNRASAVNSEHFEQVYNSVSGVSSEFKANDPEVLNALVESYRDSFAKYMKKMEKKLKKLPLNLDQMVSIDKNKLMDLHLKLPTSFYKARVSASFKFTEKGIYKVFNELIKSGRIHSDNYLSISMKKCIHRNDLVPFIEKFTEEPLDLQDYIWSFLSFRIDEETKDFSITETIDDTSTRFGQAALFCTTLLSPFAPAAVEGNKTYTSVSLDLGEDFTCSDFKVEFIQEPPHKTQNTITHHN
ncbi:predicted protein [Naegleria gruberi]|uniref:Predicted protein n=1 Tax=Naegleria gruberi TaxID=5762 RepID=D2V016_NAEGR|nr:uncharacterized protein NAEGRDRAFT_45598 [Naegleria gruberi]EFC49450.1 predicted protein [Naegleria gruberi]|eukprot:XP_002682194.1 predicted protein [Naegleria gruberi strain NEG-M]